MKVFIDTNILIDYLSRREKFFEKSALVIQLGRHRKCELLVSSLSFATTSFILCAHYKVSSERVAHKFADFIRFCHVTTVDSQTVSDAVSSRFTDFEDAMQYYSALRAGADVIVTRNKNDFSHADIPVFEPQEFMDFLQGKGN